MKRLLTGVLLSCVLAVSSGAFDMSDLFENNQSENSTKTAVSVKSTAPSSDKSSGAPGIWAGAIENYVEAQQIHNRLAVIEQSLQNLEAAPHAASQTRLKAEKSSLEKRLSTFDIGLLKDMDYYLAPQSEEISIRTKMYQRYGQYGDGLEALNAQLTQKQKELAAQVQSGKGNSKAQSELKKVTLSLEVIAKVQERLRHLSDVRLTKINELNKQLTDIEDELTRNNIWQKSYTAYLTYIDVKKNLAQLQRRIDKLKRSEDVAIRSEELDTLLSKQKILSDQLSLLQPHSTSPFADLLKPEEIEAIPEIINPLDIFSGISFEKKISDQLKEYQRRGDDLRSYLQLLLSKRQLLETLSDIDATENYTKKIAALDAMIEKYQVAASTMQDTENVYAKRIEEIELKVNKSIREQLFKLGKIGGIIVFLLVFFFVMKQIAKKYISDNERFYMANKVLTFANVTLIILVLLFNYIENVSYVVTVLGFASAGIAIAMKDWFMSMLGWLVIVFGGSIHVGDRVRVDMDGMKYVGDVLDISMLRITILEDITLTTYTNNRRAGRIIFIPNNYIFTHMIANYTHVSLKTVWDGIDITITFDSNHKKAAMLAKEVARKYAKGYTDITRNQLNKLRSRYNLKNTNVDPRIYEFAEENGIRISTWYLTNAYATLTLRSTISMEILDAYAKEDDITIAYPTQRLRLQQEPLPQPMGRQSDEGEPV